VIGVDIDTSAPQFRDMALPASGPPIVWGRSGSYSYREGKFHPDEVLGGREHAPASGLILLKEEPDGVVRRYRRMLPTPEGTAPSFAWEVLNHARCPATRELPVTGEEMLIDFTAGTKDPNRLSLTAARVKELANENPKWPEGVLKDRIVLLGGEYAVQDEHDTPLGWMLGAEVLAQVIETELRGGGRRPASRALVFTFLVVGGLAIFLLFLFFEPRRALLLAVLAIPVLATLSSLVIFGSLTYWFYFTLCLIAVLFQQIFDRFKDAKDEPPPRPEPTTGGP
jgi:CHASE2 domain-containing sensor protein